MAKRKRRKEQAIYLAFNIMALRVPDETYFRNASCALIFMSTFTRKTKPICIRFCRYLRLKPSLSMQNVLSNDYYFFLSLTLWY
jgi:hypothetical protein